MAPESLLEKENNPTKKKAKISKIRFIQKQIPFKYNDLQKISFIFIFSLFFFVYPAFSQNIPPGQDSGAQAERFKKESEQQKGELQKKETKAPEIEIQKESEKPAPTETVSFILNEVVIKGSTVFKSEDFLPVYQSYLGKQVTFNDLEKITSGIKDLYKKEGFLTTIVFIPKQEIKEGKIEIDILEGKMGVLKIEGNKWFSNSLIERYFHLKKNEIININILQKDILRLNQNSDLEIKTMLAPGQEAGSSDVTLQAKEKFPFHVGASADNQGTRLTGKFRSGPSFTSSNLTGNFDTLFIRALVSYKTQGEFVGYSLPLTTYGTKLGIDLAYYRMKIGKEFKPFDIEGTSHTLSTYINQELYLTENFQANGQVGIDIKGIKKRQLGTIIESDQLRMPYFSFDFNKIDSYGGQTTLNPKFSFSTANFLGASSRNHPTSSRAGTGGFFFKYEQSLSRYQRMPFESYATMRTSFQLASHTLPSSEQFQVGGANSVRGYPEGDYVADAGGTINLDWYFPSYFIPKTFKTKMSNLPLRNQIEPFVFFDYGRGNLKKVEPGERFKKNLMGVGGGVQLRIVKGTYLKFTWAGHVGDEPTGGAGSSTFLMSFQAEL